MLYRLLPLQGTCCYFGPPPFWQLSDLAGRPCRNFLLGWPQALGAYFGSCRKGRGQTEKKCMHACMHAYIRHTACTYIYIHPCTRTNVRTYIPMFPRGLVLTRAGTIDCNQEIAGPFWLLAAALSLCNAGYARHFLDLRKATLGFACRHCLQQSGAQWAACT